MVLSHFFTTFSGLPSRNQEIRIHTSLYENHNLLMEITHILRMEEYAIDPLLTCCHFSVAKKKKKKEKNLIFHHFKVLQAYLAHCMIFIAQLHLDSSYQGKLRFMSGFTFHNTLVILDLIFKKTKFKWLYMKLLVLSILSTLTFNFLLK